MDCLDPSVIKKRKLTQSDYKVSHIGDKNCVGDIKTVGDNIFRITSKR